MIAYDIVDSGEHVSHVMLKDEAAEYARSTPYGTPPRPKWSVPAVYLQCHAVYIGGTQ